MPGARGEFPTCGTLFPLFTVYVKEKMNRRINITFSGILVILTLTSYLLPLAKADGPILSLDGMLPSKSDDPKVYPVLQETEWYYDTSWTENLTEPGFVEGRAVEYYKRYSGLGDIRFVEFYVYLFSNVSNAEAYCSKEINATKSQVGTTEVATEATFAAVYELVDEYVTWEIGISWGTVSNVVFKVAVYANKGEDPTDRLVSFTSLERSRIVEKSNLDSVPEPASLILLPLFGLATLLAIKIENRFSSRMK